MLSLNLISTLAEAEPRYPITECRSSLTVSAVADWAGQSAALLLQKSMSVPSR